jgi:hypothetical protein
MGLWFRSRGTTSRARSASLTHSWLSVRPFFQTNLLSRRVNSLPPVPPHFSSVSEQAHRRRATRRWAAGAPRVARAELCRHRRAQCAARLLHRVHRASHLVRGVGPHLGFGRIVASAFVNRGTEYVRKSGMRWMSGSAKRQCDRARAAPRPGTRAR